jgi:hypothetical protein
MIEFEVCSFKFMIELEVNFILIHQDKIPYRKIT